MTREAMIVTCLRCGGSYDMDYEESWTDHHDLPDGTGECAPDPSKCTFVTDTRHGYTPPPYCNADHTEDWKLTMEMVDDD